MRLTDEHVRYVRGIIDDLRVHDFVLDGDAISWKLANKLEAQLWRIVQIQLRLGVRREAKRGLHNPHN